MSSLSNVGQVTQWSTLYMHAAPGDLPTQDGTQVFCMAHKWVQHITLTSFTSGQNYLNPFEGCAFLIHVKTWLELFVQNGLSVHSFVLIWVLKFKLLDYQEEPHSGLPSGVQAHLFLPDSFPFCFSIVGISLPTGLPWCHRW